MTEDQEELYERGSRAAWRQVLDMALRELGYDASLAEHWLSEREAALAQLRDLCADFGDNDWPDNLHLADVIEKHLGDYLYDENRETEAKGRSLDQLCGVNGHVWGEPIIIPFDGTIRVCKRCGLTDRLPID